MTAAEQLRDWVLSEQMTFATEADLQAALWERMERGDRPPATAPFIRAAAREFTFIASNAGRIDFLVDIRNPATSRHRDGMTSVGVEVKIKSALAEVVRQLQRYAASPLVDELLLVTTKAQHHHVPTHIGGKRVVLCSLVERGL